MGGPVGHPPPPPDVLAPVHYIVSSDFTEPGFRNLESLRKVIKGIGGEIYREIVLEGGEVPVVAIAFVADATKAQPLASMPGLVLETEAKLRRSALDTTSWALPAIATGTADVSLGYTAPVTPGEARLYLIDTSVAHECGWLGRNPNVTLALEKAIRGTNDPVEPVAFDHGTAMLSLVMDPAFGIASGTPLEVVSYDVFPEPETTSVALVASALTEAAKHHVESPWMPGVVLLALSTEGMETSYLLDRTVRSVVERGLTVVVSAGNHGGDVSGFVPAAYGEMEGVICAGAHDQSGGLCTFSNRGPAVDFLAPGVEVPAFVPATSGTVQVAEGSGTSQAAAFAAGAALIHLSEHSQASPVMVEAALLEAATPAEIPLLRLGAPVPDDSGSPGETREEIIARVGAAEVSLPAATGVSLGADESHFADPPAPVDADGDGLPDEVETFHGVGGNGGSSCAIDFDSGAGKVSFTFRVATDRFEAVAPFQLLDGGHWRLRCSTDGHQWITPVGTLSTYLDGYDRLFVTATIDAPPGSRCLLRLEIVP